MHSPLRRVSGAAPMPNVAQGCCALRMARAAKWALPALDAEAMHVTAIYSVQKASFVGHQVLATSTDPQRRENDARIQFHVPKV